MPAPIPPRTLMPILAPHITIEQDRAAAPGAEDEAGKVIPIPPRHSEVEPVAPYAAPATAGAGDTRPSVDINVNFDNMSAGARYSTGKAGRPG